MASFPNSGPSTADREFRVSANSRHRIVKKSEDSKSAVISVRPVASVLKSLLMSELRAGQ
jgi:hypothetical protein